MRRDARILHEAIERHLRAWTQAHGVTKARGGGISVLQRFGGSMNLDVHLHALVLHGVFARTAGASLRFHASPVPSSTDVAEVLATIVPHVQALVARHGLDADDASDPGDEPPMRAGWAASSVDRLVGAGAARRRPARLGVPGDMAAIAALASAHAQWDGFDLHAGVRVPAGHATHSSASAGMRSGRRSPRSGSPRLPTETSRCSCVARKAMAPRTWSSSRGPSWPAWRCSCRGRA